MNVVNQYRRLVRAPASIQALWRSLDLVRAVVHMSARGHLPAWDWKPFEHLWTKHGTPIAEHPLDSLLLGKTEPEWAARSPSQEEKLARDVVVALYVGSGFARENLKGEEYSLLFDSLLIVFHQSYFALLPRLADFPRDRLALLRSYEHFSVAVDNPAEAFRIRGHILLAVEQMNEAVESFRAALLYAHSDEHDFMTRLQTLWMLLLEKGEYLSAVDLLNEVAPKITRQDQQEFAQLFRETVEAAQNPPG